MRRKRWQYVLGAVAWLFGSAAAAPEPARAAAQAIPIWPVRWDGVFDPSDTLETNVVSPDGRWAVVTPWPLEGEFDPVLYRLEPPGPVAALSALTHTKVVWPNWLADSKRLEVGLRTEPEDIDYHDVRPGVLDLRTLSIKHLRFYPFDPIEGHGTNPNADCVRPRADSPLAVCGSNGEFVLAEREGNKLARVGPKFGCAPKKQVSPAVFALSSAVVAVRCEQELLVVRGRSAVVHVPLDPHAQSLQRVEWGEGARSVVLGNTADCTRTNRCGGIDDVRVFDAITGREIEAPAPRLDGPAWALTVRGFEIFADHRWLPERRKLPGTPPILGAWRASWQSETRLEIEAHLQTYPPAGRDEIRDVVLDLATARVLSSTPLSSPGKWPCTDPKWDNGHWTLGEADDGEALAQRLVNGRVVAKGTFATFGCGYVAFRHEGGVELWTEDGRRVGRLPDDVRGITVPSPSGRWAFEARHDEVRLIKLGTGDALAFYLVSDGPRTLAVARSPAGWFAGDAGAFAALRYARGRTLLDAVPLSGADVRAELERPAWLLDFLAGKSVPLARARVLGR